ncbi:transcriptional regulator [Moraxella bovoculi]|uniref:Transcriptional regulator n=2 Tax=Moraxella bovoculi TaxID=386891 RepID=A0AAC8PZ00_9GAMM|nr:LysR family transcriptional regulator [Moraxella bovoculi]AKG08579.1 transcriptional regulator [Moraxella bovoculi]AKG12441.1 transcriptional regulator [Moraxella bovoculi]
MNLNTLHLFVAIVQTGSLSKASERTGVPIATISRQIAELEKHLQIQLFDRQKSGVKPTMAGQKLYDEVHLSIDNLLNTKQVLFDDEQNLKGVLRISTVPACEPILGWVGEFQAQFPHIQTHCTMTDRALDMTADGIDVAFRMGELHGEQFIAKKVLSVRSKWVARPDLLAQHGTPSTMQDLANLPLAGWARNGETALSIKIDKQTHHLPYLFASNESPAVEFMAINGRAVCQLADYTADRLIKDYGLTEVLADIELPSYDVSMLYASHRYPSSIVRAFVEFIMNKIDSAS